jgi:hypothetical protein
MNFSSIGVWHCLSLFSYNVSGFTALRLFFRNFRPRTPVGQLKTIKSRCCIVSQTGDSFCFGHPALDEYVFYLTRFFVSLILYKWHNPLQLFLGCLVGLMKWSMPNSKSLQESWRAKAFQVSLNLYDKIMTIIYDAN